MSKPTGLGKPNGLNRSNNETNWNVLINDILTKHTNKFDIITIRPGRILWHARWQPLYGQRRNVMKSPDYLYTSPQVSQAILHGISTRPLNSIVELTKLRVKKPIRLYNFKTPTDQYKFAVSMGMNNFQLYTLDDIKLFKYICNSDDNPDGYRAHWDQDQIALCADIIRDKLERVSSKNFTNTEIRAKFGFGRNNIIFVKPQRKNASYYETNVKRRGRSLVKNIKSNEKKKAIERKLERKKMYNVVFPMLKKIKRKQ